MTTTAAGTARGGMTMDDETTRLRALLERAALPACEATNNGVGEWSVTHADHPPWTVAEMWDSPAASTDATEARAQIFAAIPTALPGLLDAAERAERAERERDDLRATLATRDAEHALAMARVRELEAALAAPRLRGAADALAFVHAVMSGVVHGLAEDEGKAVLMSALDAHREGRPVTLRAEFAADSAEVSRG